MLSKLIELVKTLFNLSKDIEQNRVEIKELRQDVTKLTHALQHLMNQIQLNKQDESSEREKLALTLENELLKFERRLPPDKPSQNPRRSLGAKKKSDK